MECPECGAPAKPTQHADLSPGFKYDPWNSDMNAAPKDRGMEFDMLLYYPGRRVSGPVILAYYCDGWRSSFDGNALIGTPTKWAFIPEGYQ